jgi:hypothetical protein
MNRVDQLLKLSEYLFDTYTKRTFSPKNEFQMEMLKSIIRHDSKELYLITDINDIEITYCIKMVLGMYNRLIA